MGKEYTEIGERLQAWMSRQHVFFVATAPLAGDGLVNCSPKGLDSLRVTGPMQVTYADTGGSGIETVAHLKENGRIIMMMCAFDGPPRIFRFYGKGTPIEPHHDDYAGLIDEFPSMPAVRNFIRIDVDRIIDSCGYGVPLYEFRGHRDSLANYFAKQTEDDIWAYRRKKNSASLDGLPGLDLADDNPA